MRSVFVTMIHKVNGICFSSSSTLPSQSAQLYTVTFMVILRLSVCLSVCMSACLSLSPSLSVYHRLDGSLSPVLTATFFLMGKPKI